MTVLLPPLGGASGQLARSRAALKVGSRTWSHAALAAQARANFRHLEAAGVAPGEPVAIWALRDEGTPSLLLSAVLHGAVAIPLNPEVGTQELEHIITTARPRALLAASAAGVPIHGQARTTVVPQDAHAGDGAPLEALEATSDAALVLFTSGTTGPPKGAVLSRSNIASNLAALEALWGLAPGDHLVHALPLFHVHGLVLGLLGALRAGATFEWVPRFEPAALLRAMDGERRVLYAVPTLYHRLAEQSPAALAPLGRAKLLVSGSAALPVREHERLRALTGQAIVERYGLTETLINCALPAGQAKPGYVGPAVPGTDVFLVDTGRRRLDPEDETVLGEVAVRGPNVFSGYLARPDDTEAVLEDGVFYTGDIASRDAAGNFRIYGRMATDLIKTGGFKVGAGEIEACLLEHASVREAAVVGVPDDDLGERIVAYVVPKGLAPAAEDLRAHVGEFLARHKKPKEIRFVSELPRNAMGKVQKARLR